jgi:hypothetical protein
VEDQALALLEQLLLTHAYLESLLQITAQVEQVALLLARQEQQLIPSPQLEAAEVVD